jgi:hypothetical protein
MLPILYGKVSSFVLLPMPAFGGELSFLKRSPVPFLNFLLLPGAAEQEGGGSRKDGLNLAGQGPKGSEP